MAQNLLQYIRFFIAVPEFESLYRQEETYDPTKYMFEHVSAPCYDHIWVAALALNCTDDYLKRIGNMLSGPFKRFSRHN